MNIKRFSALLIVLILALALASCNGGNDSKCDGHVDADDNYLCDKCGEHYDDGDENQDVNQGNTGVNVTFVVRFANGAPLSGVNFTLTRGDKVYSLTSGADGKVTGNIDPATYSVDVDSETLPEYCWADTYGLKVEEGVDILEIIIVDNTPNGSLENPFWLTETETEISVAPGEEIFFNYRGSTLKNITIESDNLVINFNGESFAAVNGVVSAQILPEDIGEITIFSIKNVSQGTVNALMKAYAPLGSEENPYELNGGSATATVPYEQAVHYVYTADKDGVIVIIGKTSGGSILATRNVTKYIEGFDEPIIIPIVSSTGDGSSIYTYVKAGEEIKISVSYDGDDAEEGKTNNVDYTVNYYAGTSADPVPVLTDDVSLSIDAGASVVFKATAKGTINVSASEEVSLTFGGEVLTPDETGKYTLTAKANDKFTLKNNSDSIEPIEIYLS